MTDDARMPAVSPGKPPAKKHDRRRGLRPAMQRRARIDFGGGWWGRPDRSHPGEGV